MEAKQTKFILPMQLSEAQRQVEEAIFHSHASVNEADQYKIANQNDNDNNNNVENIVNDARYDQGGNPVAGFPEFISSSGIVHSYTHILMDICGY